MGSIAENTASVRARIVAAATRAGRDPREITLVAVSKTIGADRVSEAAECGLTDFGENKVQELVAKRGLIGGLKWHMIGHLQTNKVKAAVAAGAMIHSVDSERLAREIGKRSEEAGRVTDILIEVNIAGEQSKFGVAPEMCAEFAETCRSVSGVALRGLMCVAPIEHKKGENREYFMNMRQLLIDIRRKIRDNERVTHLSMGMTDDFETAIECGSTIIRVGTGIFGARCAAV